MDTVLEKVVIIQDDDPKLKTVSLAVERFDDVLDDLIEKMTMAMLSRRGIGLSAIQIGEPKRVILINLEGKIDVMVNPVITRTLNREMVDWEGCLSIDESKWRWVSRPAKCDITWQDRTGEFHSGSFSNLRARVIQHEIDHLDGVLITDKPYVSGPK